MEAENRCNRQRSSCMRGQSQSRCLSGSGCSGSGAGQLTEKPRGQQAKARLPGGCDRRPPENSGVEQPTLEATCGSMRLAQAPAREG